MLLSQIRVTSYLSTVHEFNLETLSCYFNCHIHKTSWKCIHWYELYIHHNKAFRSSQRIIHWLVSSHSPHCHLRQRLLQEFKNIIIAIASFLYIYVVAVVCHVFETPLNHNIMVQYSRRNLTRQILHWVSGENRYYFECAFCWIITGDA